MSQLAQQPGSNSVEAIPYPRPLIAWYSVGVLLVLYIFSFIDRQIISLLVEPMKRDLQISDTQIGLLQGLTFAVFYTFLGFPIARLADRYDRRWIIGVGVFFWSIMATCCGLARTWTQLLLARVGVGVGEAALSPSAYSLITDSFPRSKLGGAFSLYNIGITIGSGIALLVGGIVVGAVSHAGDTYHLPIVGDVRAWQMIFIATGAPGILLPLLVLTLREPARRGLLRQAGTNAPADQPPLREVLRYVSTHRHFYGLHFFALGLLSMVGYAMSAWLPTAIHRTYGISAAEAGKFIGVSTLVVNSLGMVFAGRISDWLTKRGRKDAPILVCACVACLIGTLSAMPTLMPTITLMWCSLPILGFPFNAYNGIGPMAVNQVTPNQLRAQVSSLYLFVVNILGLGVGPWLVPFISDHIFHDPAMIKYSLPMVAVFGGLTAALLLFLERPVYSQKNSQAVS